MLNRFLYKTGLYSRLLRWLNRKSRSIDLLLFPLTFLSEIYSLLMIFRRAYYRRYRSFKGVVIDSKRKKPLVISVGNIVAGGTGKTPFTIFLAQYFNRQGYSIAVVQRGYKKKTNENDNSIFCVEAGSDLSLGKIVLEGGDEVAMLAKMLPFANIYSCSNRKKVLANLENRFDVVILDDAFQHLKVRRDFDFVLLNSKKPFSSERCFPRGLLREPISCLKDADCMIFTHFMESEWRIIKNKLDNLKYVLPGKKIIRTKHTPVCLRTIDGSIEISLDTLKDNKVLAFCGIGNPEGFFAGIKELGIRDLVSYSFPDHFDYGQTDLQCLENEMEKQNCDIMLTTLKDAIKLSDLIIQNKVYFLDMKIDVISDDTEKMQEILRGFN